MKPRTELFYADGVAADGRTLTGRVVKYGETTKRDARKVRIEPGAFGDLASADVILNAGHDRGRPIARTGGGGLELADSASELTLRATLPDTRDANDVLALVKSGVLRGVSAEVEMLDARLESGVRVVRSAKLVGVGVVDTPAFPSSAVEVHAREPSTGAAPVPWWY